MPDAEHPLDLDGTKYRHIMAYVVLSISLAGITVIAVAMIVLEKGEARTVWSTIVPLFGSWVGTVLAFYFSRENLEAATRNMGQIAKVLTPQEKLGSTPVQNKMIPKQAMHFETVSGDPSGILLKDVLSRLAAAGKGDRIPFLDRGDRPLYVIHRSLIDKFLATKALANSGPATLTLAQLLDESELKGKAADTYATVPKDATLADAKQAMDRKAWCQDVFVTEKGHAGEPVLGWITNVIIEDNAKV